MTPIPLLLCNYLILSNNSLFKYWNKGVEFSFREILRSDWSISASPVDHLNGGLMIL